VWIDLCPVPGGTPGAFQPATISAASETGGSVLYASTNTRGFFVTASPATVTATLDNAAGKFNWCAYGSDAPPQAEVLSGGGYKLHGTPPFTINGTITENTKTFGAGTCITSITDLTGNPDGIAAHDIAQATISGDASNTCPALTVVLTTTASGATTFTWYKNGSQVQSGTSTSYTVTATDSYTVQGKHAYCTGTASAAKVVTISSCCTGTTCPGCATPTLLLTGAGFTSSASYTINGIILSSPVTVTTCQKESYSTSNNTLGTADCRTAPGFAGHLFSWCAVMQFANVLCPPPWHVPLKEDYIKLGCEQGQSCYMSYTQYAGINGWELYPNADNNGSLFTTTHGYRIASQDTGSYMAENIGIYADRMSMSTGSSKAVGMPLRCVQ
jgi:uncharacterized protein (TIGR02145 family)